METQRRYQNKNIYVIETRRNQKRKTEKRKNKKRQNLHVIEREPNIKRNTL